MEIILLENIKKLGNTGDLVNVKDGFARNFLIPQQKAVRATNDNKSRFQDMAVELVQKNETLLKNSLKAIEQLQDLKIILVRQAGEDGKLYGSVAARDIVNALKDQNVTVLRENIVLEESIKYLGEYKIKISLHSQAETEITVQIVRNEKAE